MTNSSAPRFEGRVFLNMLIGLRQHRTLLPPPQGEGDREAVEGVYLQWQDTPPATACGGDSPLSEGAKSRFLLMLS